MRGRRLKYSEFGIVTKKECVRNILKNQKIRLLQILVLDFDFSIIMTCKFIKKAC